MPLDIASRWGNGEVLSSLPFSFCGASRAHALRRHGWEGLPPHPTASHSVRSSLLCNGVCASVLMRAKRLCLSGSITSPHACGSLCSVVSSLRVQNNRLCLFFVWKRVVEKVRQLCALPFYRFASLHGYGRKCSALLAFSSYAFKQKTKFCIIEGTQKPTLRLFNAERRLPRLFARVLWIVLVVSEGVFYYSTLF